MKTFLLRLLKAEKQTAKIVNIIFCTDAYLLDVNQFYLQHDYYTDIITFVLSPPKKPLVADLYISVERVRENARALAVPFTRELHRVVFHGLLHLCGFNDISISEIAKMRMREEFYLDKYFVPRETN